MIHFAYLAAFALFVSVAFGAMSTGTSIERVRYGIKTFFQFLIVSLVLAWILYFIPWN
ncbi:MAG TPA: hypothetical protein VL325_06465 [Pyrinomonadaceae bacterium]|jgi:hypothetical protein|nr:hypothetical protein [Pyrinomonadaceae bacterium]